MLTPGAAAAITSDQADLNTPRNDYGASGVVAVTGGAAEAGDTVSSTEDDFDVSPVVIDEVTGEVNVPGSDTIMPLPCSLTATANAPMATIALPPTTADSVLMFDISTLPIGLGPVPQTGSAANPLPIG
ncbi:hypothetical protein GCM10010533_34300 [Mycolicibacterium pallens]|nr:hypothetical protein BOH72_29165 [Mycobacterium sp. WY10]